MECQKMSLLAACLLSVFFVVVLPIATLLLLVNGTHEFPTKQSCWRILVRYTRWES